MRLLPAFFSQQIHRPGAKVRNRGIAGRQNEKCRRPLEKVHREFTGMALHFRGFIVK
jgi:hypothetical protein